MAQVDAMTVVYNCSGPGSFPLQSKTKFSVPSLTAGNFAAQAGLMNTLQQKIQPLTNGVISSWSVSLDNAVSTAYPSVPANRGSKWIITADNGLGQKFTYTIPAAKEDVTAGTGTLLPDGVSANLAATPWTDFEAAFHAVATDRAGVALVLKGAKLGGRRR